MMPSVPTLPTVPTASAAPARACAYTVLRRVFEQGAYADRALTAEAAALDPRDRALAMRLAYGAVQRKGTLDHLVEQLAERPAATLDAPLLAALRLGLYELLYMRGAPDYAVVGDAVELAKAHARAGHGLVNAVLRRAAREGADALLGPLGEDTPEQAAVKHSHPEWIARLWWQSLGAQDARALMAAPTHSSPTPPRLPPSCPCARTPIPTCPRRSCSSSRSTCTAPSCGAPARSTRNRARRCASRACSTRSPASACSTCAPPPAARRPTWPR
jgi:transcription termination factor NusB